MKVHPAAEFFPLMDEDELAELAEDIKRNGLQMSIVRTKDGRIVDGRNRELACKMAGVKPIYEDLESDNGDMVALVVSLNVKRRNLSPSQKAMAAAEAWKMEDDEQEAAEQEAEARGRRHKPDRKVRPGLQQGAQSGGSAKRFAKLFGSNNKYVEQARAVLQGDPTLAREVKVGNKTIADAYTEFQRSEGKEAADREKLRRLRIDHADLAEAVDAKTMTLPDAVAAADERDANAKQRQWSATMNVLDGLAHFDRPAVAKQAEVEAALISEEAAATRGEKITPERLRNAAAWATLLADALEGKDGDG